MEAQTWKAPLVITEFGYNPAGIQADNYLSWQSDLQDQVLASAFFWVWKEESQGAWGLFDHDASTDTWTERDHVRQALSRVVAEAVAGWPTKMGYDRTAKRFELDFTGDPAITAPSRIYVPTTTELRRELRGDLRWIEARRDAGRSDGLGIEVPCHGPGSHVIVVSGH